MEREIFSLVKGFVNQGFMLSDEGVDFAVHGYKEFELFNQKLYITTTHISTIIVSATLIILSIIINLKLKKVKEDDTPGIIQNIAEVIVGFIDGLIANTMGAKHGMKYANYIGTVLIFIFFSNISGLFGLRPPTADYGTTVALALITFVLVQFTGFKFKGLGKIKELFEPMPLLFPLNLIGEFSTPLSMSLRLFGAVLSGTIMMALYYGMLPLFATVGIPAALHVYFDLFAGAIQAFVFCMLTMVFISSNFPEQE